MNTTDQTFIRAYGSDVVPSYADEAARAADYPALADSNVNAVFGSRPQPHYRVDGPSVAPNAVVPPVQGNVLPPPLPARPYMPQHAPTHQAMPVQPTIANQSPTPSRPQVPQPVTPVTAAPKQHHAEPTVPTSLQNDAVHHEPAREHPSDSVQVHNEHQLYAGAEPPTASPVANHPRVPRPHINFAAVKETQPADATTEIKRHVNQPTQPSSHDKPWGELPKHEVPMQQVSIPQDVSKQQDVANIATPIHTVTQLDSPKLDTPKQEAPIQEAPIQETPSQLAPRSVVAQSILTADDGLAMLTDSSMLVGSSVFEWPPFESATETPPAVNIDTPPPAVAVPPTTEAVVPKQEANQPAACVAEPTAGQIKAVDVANDAKAATVEPETASAETVSAETANAVAEPEVEVAEPKLEETPLNPSIADVDREAAGAELEAVADEPSAVPKKLKPAWEVDRLLWPADADQLYESESEYFRHAGEKLRDASHEGLRVLGVSSSHVGEGCTTLAICLARAAAASGAKVALLDANLRSPQLGTALGLDFARSWHEALDGVTALAEAAVTAIADNVTLIPLAKNAVRQGLKLNHDAVNDILQQASESFDLVLIDVGSGSDDERNSFQGGDACPLDAAIVVRDVRATSEEETLESVSRFRALGIEAVGIAENFASASVAHAAA